MNEQSKPKSSYLRFFYALPSPHVLDLLIDDKMVLKKFQYQDFTKYFKIPHGLHHIKFLEHATDHLIYEKKINLRPHSAFTQVLGTKYKTANAPHLFALEEHPREHLHDKAFLCLNHFSPHSSPMDFLTSDNQLFFKNISYAQNVRYMPIPLGSYEFQLFDRQDPPECHTHLKHRIKPYRFYSFYFIGDGSPAYPYQLIPSIDGISYLNIQKNIR